MQRFGWSLSLALPSVLAAAVAAGCFIYLIRSPFQVDAAQTLTPYAPNLIIQDKEAPVVDRPKNDEEKAIEAFKQAADAILSRASNLRAEMPHRPVGAMRESG